MVKINAFMLDLQAFFWRVESLKVEVSQVRFALDQNLWRHLKESQAVLEW